MPVWLFCDVVPLAQSGCMDQGDAAVWAAGIGVVGTVIGAIGGYLAGRVQGKATVDGVRLQLTGQREDALWQAEVEAFAALVAQFNTARLQIGNVAALCDATRRERTHLATFGFGTPEQAFAALTECFKEVVTRENALRLRTAPAYADAATEVRERMIVVLDALRDWYLAREARSRHTAARRQEFDDRMDSFRTALDAFVEE
jgi:hypothetical protein